MKKKIAAMVGQGNVSDNPLDLKAYSYCSSDSEQKPDLVIWPSLPNQIRRLMVYFNQTHTPVTIRGDGTGKVDSSIRKGGVILCSERMNKIKSINTSNKVVEVESGVRIADLNKDLAEFNLTFPITPFFKSSTIGGLISINVKSKESHQLNSMGNWVEEVEFVDGTGKIYYTKKPESVIGNEGLSGFITKARLKVISQPIISIDVFKYEKLQELLGKVRSLNKDKQTYFLEFFDKNTSEELGFNKNYLLIVGYTGMKGKNKTLSDVRELLQKIDSVHSIIRSKGYYYVQDPFVTLEKCYDLIEWCEKNNVALRGHIGIGLFYAYLKKEDKELIKTFRSFVRRINGWLGKGFGYGPVNKDFMTPPKKKELMRLKEEYDYNNILLPEKIISYR